MDQQPAAAATAPQPAAATTAAISVKLPDFWKNDPAMWFVQAEAQFVLAGVVRDETKYYHIISKIDQSVICHVSDLIQNPPVEEKYDKVKARLISRFEVSAQGKLEILLHACDLGDMRPTHLLARMQELEAGLNISDDVLRALFLQRMPDKAKPILSISDGTLAKLAEMADKIVESTAAAVAATTSSAEGELSSLHEQITNLTAEIRRLKTSGVRPRSRSRSMSRGNSESDGLCWYHRKYKKKAHQCRDPCKFDTSKN
ncbi:uncharacterized protein LOC128745852 [Sabethes cyaneus]|uniref:uncharacterized protein LOC128745852 n=1 Tax=Sabethes cyaneus TaxID=53552 RepID=UPI00237D4AF9|nr:uncharacterized protein LOC128745852 [Sabethes cyaneus]